MGIVMRNILLCLMLGAGCSIYYETIVPVRVWRTVWVKYTAVPALQSLILSVLFCAAMWIVTAIVVSAVYALPPGYRGLEMIEE